MKLQKITIGTLAIALAFAAVTVAKAESDDTVSPADIRAKIEDRRNQERATLQDKSREARKDDQSEARILKADARDTKRIAVSSTTVNFKREAKIAERNLEKRMELRQFEIRRDALVRVLNIAIRNLESIVERIESRIAKAESSGRDMSEPKSLLPEAKDKISAAKAEIVALQNLTISTSSPSNATTTQVELDKPRKVGDAAIKGVKDARDALKAVVVSIAKNMGLGKSDDSDDNDDDDGSDDNATSTPGTGSTTPLN